MNFLCSIVHSTFQLRNQGREEFKEFGFSRITEAQPSARCL
jgi:hypothetical protein